MDKDKQIVPSDQLKINGPRQPIDISELQKELVRIAVILGIKNPPEPEEIQIMAQFIIAEFKDFAIEEVRMAVQKAVARKLDIDPEHYQSFSIPYIGKVLDAYRPYRHQQNLLAKKNEQVIPEERQLEGPGKDEKAKKHFAWVCEITTDTGKLPHVADWGLVHHYLMEVERVEVTDEEWEKFKNGVRDKMKAIAGREKFNGNMSIAKELLSAIDNEQSFEGHCSTEWTKQHIRDTYIKAVPTMTDEERQEIADSIVDRTWHCDGCDKETEQSRVLYNQDEPEQGEVWQCNVCKEAVDIIENQNQTNEDES